MRYTVLRAFLLLHGPLAACAIESDPSLGQHSERQIETRDLIVSAGETCGMLGARLGYRQHELACLHLPEDTQIGPGAPCPDSLRFDENGNEAAGADQRCKIFSAVGDVDNGQWDGIPNSTTDCTLCAFYSQDPDNHPRPLTCEDQNNRLTGIFALEQIVSSTPVNRTYTDYGLERRAWLMLFQSTRGVRGVVCEAEDQNNPGTVDCALPNPEVAGYFDAKGELHLTKYQVVRNDDDSVSEVREVPLFSGKLVPEGDYVERYEIGGHVLHYEEGRENLCTPSAAPNAPSA